MKGKFINKTLYKYESRHLWSMLLWAVIIAGLMVASMSLFPTISSAMDKMPAELKPYLVGMDSINSYFESQASQSWVFFVCIYGAYLSMRLISSELKGKSCEMIYTSPMSRGEIVRTKALRLFVNISLINLIVAAASFVSLVVWGTMVNYGNFTIYCIAVWLVTLVVSFFVFGLCLLFKKRFNVLGAILLLLVLYVLATLATQPNTEWLGYLSPQSVVGGGILADGFKGLFLNGLPLVIWCGLTIALNIFAFCKFRRSDLC